MGSCLAEYLDKGDEQTFKSQFRMTRAQLFAASDALAARGFLTTNHPCKQYYPVPFQPCFCHVDDNHSNNTECCCGALTFGDDYDCHG